MTTFTPVQAAKVLRISRSKLMGWIHSGQLAASNLGDGTQPRYRISEAAINELLERRAVRPAARSVRQRITRRTTENFFA